MASISGHALRESGYSGIILYLTSSTDFAIDSYDVRAFHYLLKPITPENFSLCSMLPQTSAPAGRMNTS